MSMEWKDPINTEDTAKEEARQRIEARRVAREKRQRRNRIVSTTALAASSLCLGIILGARITTGSRELHTEPPAPAIPTSEISVTATPIIQRPVATEPMPNAEPLNSEPDLALIDGRVMSEATPALLPSVPLDKETQWSLYEICGNNNQLFCGLMAIGYQESRFIPTVVGDNGNSIGTFQINRRWHTERMERLGVTDLTDTIQCGKVAVDYIAELTGSFGWVDGELLYLAYNAGGPQASDWIAREITSTEYSRECLALYQGYLAEMEAQG